MLKSLLDISVSIFALTGDAEKEITSEEEADKIVLTVKEKEREEREEKKESTKERKEEKEEKEKEFSLCGKEIPDKFDSNVENKAPKVNTTSSLKSTGSYRFLQSEEDAKRSLTQAMEAPAIKKRMSDDIHKWKPQDFVTYYQRKYKETVPDKNAPVQPGRDHKHMKDLMEAVSDAEDIKEVIDFVFENWKVISEEYDFKGFPTIGLLFSWFATFQSMMHKGKPRSKHFVHRRSDYDFNLPKGIVRRPKNVNKGND
jgi:hypothetical protein